MRKFQVTIIEDRCKSCELCVEFCKQELIKIFEGKQSGKGLHPAQQINPEKCTGCGACYLVCPDSAVTIECADEPQ